MDELEAIQKDLQYIRQSEVNRLKDLHVDAVMSIKDENKQLKEDNRCLKEEYERLEENKKQIVVSHLKLLDDNIRLRRKEKETKEENERFERLFKNPEREPLRNIDDEFNFIVQRLHKLQKEYINLTPKKEYKFLN